MKLLTAAVSNFASYTKLIFSFDSLGLALVQGATGSGKSTLNAIPGWILFGISAKNGNVDEIRNWKHLGEPTRGCLELITSEGLKITVTRVRGRNSENDLYVLKESSDEKIRGKDLIDTQRLIEDMLGITAEEYSLASSFNEFSESAAFFMAKAKNRRDLLEKLADLSLPIKLESAAADRKQSLKKRLANANNRIAIHAGTIDELQRGLSYSNRSSNAWKTKQIELIAELENKNKNFDSHKKKQIEKLSERLQHLENISASDNIFATRIAEVKESLKNLKDEKCDTCGNLLNSNDRINHQRDIEILREAQLENSVILADYKSCIEGLKNVKESVNNYQEMLDREIAKENPFLKQIERGNADLAKKMAESAAYEADLAGLKHELQSVDLIKDLSYSLRASLLRDTVAAVQNRTNQYLDQYFDASLRVYMTVEDADKLQVSIQNNGYDCAYTQLSKGQRQLLRLCFSISVMEAAANKIGTHIEAIFLDEALDGLDSALKVKAFRLLEELSKKHSTVLVVDHAPELQELFSSRYYVTLSDDESRIEDQSE